MDVLCTDKTGTLTQNKLTLGDPYTVGELSPAQVILDASLASRADDADAIDLAVLGGLADDQSLDDYHVVEFQPFDAVRKCTEATVTAADGSSFKVTKGAPQVILELSANASQVKTDVDAAVNGSRHEASVRWVWPGPKGTVRGTSSACYPCSIHPRRRQGDHRHRPRDGRGREDGHRRCPGHRPGDGQHARDGYGHPRCLRTGRHEHEGPRRRPSPSTMPTGSPKSSPSTSSTSSTSSRSEVISSA